MERVNNIQIVDLDKINCATSNSEKYIVDNEFRGALPIYDADVMFEDDVWDFKKRYLEKNSKFNFSDIHYAFKNYAKIYVLESFTNNSKISTVKKNFGVLRYVCRFLEANYIYTSEGITMDVIIKLSEDINNKFKSEGERARARKACNELMKKIETKTEVNYKFLKDFLKEQNNPDLRNAQKESGKTKNIDKDLFAKIIAIAFKELNDEKTTEKEKIQAGVILILTQTGIRVSDVASLEANKIREINGIDGETKLRYLEFFSYKIFSEYSETFVSDICYEAYKKLEELSGKSRESLKTSYLFAENKDKHVESETIENYVKRFTIRNSQKLGLLNKELEGYSIYTEKLNKTKKLVGRDRYDFLQDGYVISIPTPHQYRVAVCNDLIDKGVDFKWVKKHMGHLTSEMTEHYTRLKEEENNKVIESIVKKDFNLIGKESERLIEKIDEFIKKGNYNIKNDLDEIIQELSKKVPIRAKKNGYCIKSSFGKKCKYNEFMCAFEVCPNHCTSYLFADVSYKRYKESVKVIEYNNSNGFISEANVERNKLKRLVDDYFIQELDELNKEITTKGIDKILLNNKNLKYLCDNIDKVIDEVKKWREKN